MCKILTGAYIRYCLIHKLKYLCKSAHSAHCQAIENMTIDHFQYSLRFLGRHHTHQRAVKQEISFLWEIFLKTRFPVSVLYHQPYAVQNNQITMIDLFEFQKLDSATLALSYAHYIHTVQYNVVYSTRYVFFSILVPVNLAVNCLLCLLLSKSFTYKSMYSTYG